MSAEHAGGRRATALTALVSDEAALWSRVCGRDLEAFETLYRDYHPRLTRFLTNIARRAPLVEEVLNDTMMVVWTRPDSFAGASRLSTWIFAIAYRKARKALARFDEPIEDHVDDAGRADDEGPDAALGRQRVKAELLRAMGGLSPAHRAVVDLTYFHDMSYREIAEIMDCPVDTVKTRMFHARRKLRTALGGGVTDWL